MASNMPADDLDATWAGDDSYDVAVEDSVGSHVLDSDEQVQEPDFSAATALDAPGDSPSHGATTADGTGDYDPEAAIPTPRVVEPVNPKPAQQAASRKRKTAGGFLVGDSDSEDDSSTPASITVPAAPDSHASQLNRSLLHQSASAQHETNTPLHIALHSQTDFTTGNLGNALLSDARLPAAPNTIPLPHDTVGLLEARVQGDARGQMDAWQALIAEHRRRNKTDDARTVYNRFLEVFPQSADVWIAFIEMELGENDFVAAEALFNRCLKDVLNVPLWTVYLDYIRRRNDLSDPTGKARNTVSLTYDFVLDNIGLDKDSGKIWQEYIQFVRFGPGTIGGAGWQDQQKMDQLRKAYQRAICVPISNVNTLWKEYDQFEMGLNKMTGRKFLADRSPAYMSAKSANTALENLTRDLHRSNLPRLPPAPGFDGDQEYAEQVELWRKWIAWEKSDPLELKLDDPPLLNLRVLYCYKQALMALRFWPDMWVDAAEWCFEHKITEDGKDMGMDFLLRGIAANPESILLALKHADRIELTHEAGEGDEAKRSRGAAVRAPYDKILDTLYQLIKMLKEKEKFDIGKVEEAVSAPYADDSINEDDDNGPAGGGAGRVSAKDEQIALLRQGVSAQVDLLSKSLTFVWIALARAMRRIQGKGDLKGPLGGLRQIFQDARSRGRLGSEIYVAIAKMEWKCYNDKAGGKIFDRGAKLFPEDPYFMIEYIKYMIAHNDITNSRVVFETCVNRLTQKPDSVHKARALLSYMHKREADYGDLARVVELESRMAALYPQDPKLAKFSTRFSTERFDPIAARIIISPGAQLRPKTILTSVEKAASMQNSPRPALHQPNSPRLQLLLSTNSPKRPFPSDDFVEDLNPPRKIHRGDQREFQRGESPLKGAAGRRLDQQRRMKGQGPVSANAPPVAIPTMVTFMLGQMPAAVHYAGSYVEPAHLVRLINSTDVDVNAWEAAKANSARQGASHGRQVAPPHARQLSAEFSQFHGRISPALAGRPLSPYGADRGRLGPVSGIHGQSSLRPESRDSYEPPPATYRQDVPPPQFAPPLPTQFDNSSMPTWQQPPQTNAYGAAPPQQGYPLAPVYQQQPPSQQGPYSGYRY